MTRIVNTHEAKTHFSELLDDALAGEEIIVARAGKPLVRLVPVEPPPAPRPLGSARGRFVIHEPFYEPLPESMFEALQTEPGAKGAP
jgi:prevent-host-death family protein